VLLCAALILAAQSPLSAQEVRVSSRPYAPSPFVLRVDTNLVETGVVVRDYRGHAIAGLTQGDFKILDDGKEREITAFSVETSASARKSIGTVSGATPASPAATEQPPQPPSATPAIGPRYVALLFDDVHTRHGDLAHARVAAERFVREALQPGDRVAILPLPGPGFWRLPRTPRS
jgi:VWFA-related protein